MIYLGLEVNHYKQLLVIDAETVGLLKGKIESIIKQNDIAVILNKNGFYLLGTGEEADPKDVLDIAFQLLAVLEEYNNELFGYTLILERHDDQRTATIEASMTAAFLDILEGEGLWIRRQDKELFGALAVFQDHGEYHRILESKKAEPVFNVISYIPQIRRRIIQRFGQFLLARFFRTKNTSSVLLVTGRNDIAKKEITQAALTSIIGKERTGCLQIIEQSDPSRSALFPFIESIKATKNEVLKRVPAYLLSFEKAVWKNHENLLTHLMAGKAVSGDHTEEDFFILYGLYLTAYFRMLREVYLPGIIIFDHPDAFPESVVGRLQVLFPDLGRNYRIAVIVISGKRDVPTCFSAFKKTRVTIRPFGYHEIRNCFAALYAGLVVPPTVIRMVERLSGGRYGAVLHYIYYLRLKGKIVQEKDRFRWVPAREMKIKIPLHSRTAAMTIVKSLKEEARTILYIWYCCGGFFTDVELVALFSSIGLHIRKVEEQLLYLTSMRFLFDRERPGFSRIMRAFLRRLSPQKTKYLDDQLAAYLRDRVRQFIPWRAARVFRLCAALRQEDLIIAIVPQVINYFLDSRHFEKAEFYLSPENYLKTDRLNAEQKEALDFPIFSYRLRLLLLKGRAVEAAAHIARFDRSTESLVPDANFARLYIELGRYSLAVSETEKAIPMLKKAMHAFQELDQPAPTSESFLELGCAFLAKGNLREALDYFVFSKKMIQDLSAPLIHARSLLFESIALYLAGNYSRILANYDEATLLAQAHGLREMLLLFTFFKVRVLFDLGFYERASRSAEECLSVAALYGVPAAETTLYAWIARTMCYRGHPKAALTMLSTLPETDETLFFRGEAHYFLNEDKKAEKTFVKALHIKNAALSLFPEYTGWESGFALVEGRCLALNTNGTPLFRLARAFRALLQCRGKNLAEGVAELHLLTITEKFSPADPHVFLFYFIYYLVLRTIEKDKTSFAEIGHALTILNKALKHLQERSTMIDEARDRIYYVTQNYWNKFIFDESKSRKLM